MNNLGTIYIIVTIIFIVYNSILQCTYRAFYMYMLYYNLLVIIYGKLYICKDVKLE